MSFKALYEFCQTLEPKVSRKILVPKVCELTRLPEPKPFIVSAMTDDVSRGFIVFPGDTQHPFARMAAGRPVIGVARGLNYCWTRFVFVKELMHYFDEPLEKTSSPGEFEQLLDEFEAPKPQRSPAFHSDVQAFWMALAVLCPEKNRQQFEQQRAAGAVTDLDIATELKIPEQYVPSLFRADYKATIAKLLAET